MPEYTITTGVGGTVGARVGATEGANVGAAVGDAVGASVGIAVGGKLATAETMHETWAIWAYFARIKGSNVTPERKMEARVLGFVD